MANRFLMNKVCNSCGKEHLIIPEDAQLAEVIQGVLMYFWNCDCHSTLAVRIEDTVVLDGSQASSMLLRGE